MPSEAHVHCYTHHQGSLTISVRKLPEILLKGERDGKIWMWHRCLLCPRDSGFPPATRRVVMSDAAWGLSFGKFLELSFSNHAAASRVASCGHSLHRDCLRFYGYLMLHSSFFPLSIGSSATASYADFSVLTWTGLEKWLLASVMHQLMFTLYTCLLPSLISIICIKSGYRRRRMRSVAYGKQRCFHLFLTVATVHIL